VSVGSVSESDGLGSVSAGSVSVARGRLRGAPARVALRATRRRVVCHPPARVAPRGGNPRRAGPPCKRKRAGACRLAGRTPARRRAGAVRARRAGQGCVRGAQASPGASRTRMALCAPERFLPALGRAARRPFRDPLFGATRQTRGGAARCGAARMRRLCAALRGGTALRVLVTASVEGRGGQGRRHPSFVRRREVRRTARRVAGRLAGGLRRRRGGVGLQPLDHHRHHFLVDFAAIVL
jgi:hypothetical protein